MPYSYAKAFAPATVANVGPGFDVFGFALEGAGDEVEVTLTEKKGVRLIGIEGDGGKLPRDPARNVATAVVAKILREFKPGFGVDVLLRKGLPLGSGMGSSSASAVAAAMAMNGLLGGLVAPPHMLDAARYGEMVACGAAHADNVAPALFGGFTIIRVIARPKAEAIPVIEVVRMQAPPGWYVAVVHPHFELPTKKARAAVPKSVTVAQMTANVGNAAALIAALAKQDIRLFGRALMGDAVVVPARKKLIKGFDAVVAAAMRSGTAGVTISGAGPSIVALTDDRERAKVIGTKMVTVWKRMGIAADLNVSVVGAPGARILDRR